MADANGSVQSDQTGAKIEQFFPPIDSGEGGGTELKEVESYCVNCSKNGTTKLLLTSIPFFRDVIISSFSCPHCDYVNNEIQPAGDISEKGIEFRLDVRGTIDLNRQVITSDYSQVSIPELQLEIGQGSQKGQITTVEGILDRLLQGLEQDQERRKIQNPDEFAQIAEFMAKVHTYKSLDLPFTLILRDLSGNCFIGPCGDSLPTEKDGQLRTVHFTRNAEENHLLGIFSKVELEGPNENDEAEVDINDEVHQFTTNCSQCGAPCSTKMKVTKIPYFKEVIIMGTDCDACGNRTNEVKSGSGIEPKGRKITLEVSTSDDLSRDILKSETCSLEIPALELEVGGATFGGKFTTLEGLLKDVRKQLIEENPMISGDSSGASVKAKMKEFGDKFDRLLSLEVPFKLILDDPAGNSYVQNICAPDADPQIETLDYDRTFDQNEDLGLNDMKVENYQEDEVAPTETK